MVVTLSVLAGACPAYAAALVDGVAEAEGVAAFVFDESVVALGVGVRSLRRLHVNTMTRLMAAPCG